MSYRMMLVGAFGAAMLATSTQAAHVTRAWHTDRSDPDSTLCRESGATRPIITTGLGSAVRYDNPTLIEWRRAGCEASRQHHLTNAGMLRHQDELMAQMRPLDFSRDILPGLQRLADQTEAAKAREARSPAPEE